MQVTLQKCITNKTGRREETANEQSHEQEQGQNAKAEIAKTSNQPNKNQKGGNGKNEVQNQSKTQLTQGQQEEIQEE